VIIITICVFVITAILSPETNVEPNGPVALCDDPSYDPNKGFCSYLKYQSDKSVSFHYRLKDVKALHRYIKAELRPVLKTDNSEELGKNILLTILEFDTKLFVHVTMWKYGSNSFD
jgi:hypothetical protein